MLSPRIIYHEGENDREGGIKEDGRTGRKNGWMGGWDDERMEEWEDGGSKRHSLQAVELSQQTQAAVQIVSNNNNNNNNCLKSNIQCIEIRVQWTVHLGSSHMHVHAVTRVHAVTPKLVICVMYLTSI